MSQGQPSLITLQTNMGPKPQTSCVRDSRSNVNGMMAGERLITENNTCRIQIANASGPSFVVPEAVHFVSSSASNMQCSPKTFGMGQICNIFDDILLNLV